MKVLPADWIVPLHGLGNALAMTIDVFSEPGDGVVIFSPVYHAFASKIRAADRQVEHMRNLADLAAIPFMMTGLGIVGDPHG